MQREKTNFPRSITADRTDDRRCANYKPNIWSYDVVQSLTTHTNLELMTQRAEMLKNNIKCLLMDVAANQTGPTMLELVDWIEKLGLANLFRKEIDEAIHTIGISFHDNGYTFLKDDYFQIGLYFRLLRQHGYRVSLDVFNVVGDKTCMLAENRHGYIEGIVELFEATHLALEGEEDPDESKAWCASYLKDVKRSCSDDAAKAANVLELPVHWRVQWVDVKRNISVYEKGRDNNSSLLELAKLNFNLVQSVHQKTLKDMSRWWINLDLINRLSFTRDRLVESFMWAVGVAYEPEYVGLRKWLTKAINFVLVIDDVYDIYGSLEELQSFTSAVDSWDPNETQQLPDCMKICFQALHDTTLEVADEMHKERATTCSVLPHLKQAWGGFCKAMLVEAEWYNTGCTPSLHEYLNNGWVSSGGPLLCLHAFLSAITVHEDLKAEPIEDLLKKTHELMRCSSLVIRLCNDLGTSTAEIERGDAPSSIVCYMREAKVTEKKAREHIKDLIVATWKGINEQCISLVQRAPELKPLVRIGTNIARVAHCIYQHGDGFGVQDRETKEHILSLLIKPLPV